MNKDKRDEHTEEYLVSKFRDDFDKLCEESEMLKNLSHICRERGKDRYETILYILSTFHEFHKLVKASGRF